MLAGNASTTRLYAASYSQPSPIPINIAHTDYLGIAELFNFISSKRLETASVLSYKYIVPLQAAVSTPASAARASRPAVCRSQPSLSSLPRPALLPISWPSTRAINVCGCSATASHAYDWQYFPPLSLSRVKSFPLISSRGILNIRLALCTE